MATEARGLYALKPWYTRRLGGALRAAVRRGTSPDISTALGVLSAAGAAVVIALGWWPLALVLLAGEPAGEEDEGERPPAERDDHRGTGGTQHTQCRGDVGRRPATDRRAQGAAETAGVPRLECVEPAGLGRHAAHPSRHRRPRWGVHRVELGCGGGSRREVSRRRSRVPP